MEIEKIYPPYIYSIKYDGQEFNEYERLLGDWRDVDKMMAFFEKYKDFLNTDIWVDISGPEAAVEQVTEEADELEILLSKIFKNTKVDKKPDFDSFFKYLNGKYKFEFEYIPMKSYGVRNPSLIRMYAIKMSDNKYIITGGGIKLCKKIQDSPDLQDHVFQNIDAVISWLKRNGIYTE